MYIPSYAEFLAYLFSLFLLTSPPPLEGHHSAGPLPAVVWEAPAHLGFVHDISPFLAEALARADTSSAGAGGGTPPQLPSPLFEALPLPSGVLGPEFRRLDQAFATIDPKFLNFESDGDDLEEESVSPPPPAPSTSGDLGAVPQNPDAVEVPVGPSLHPQDEDAQLWGHVLLDAEMERMKDAVNVTLYPLPPPTPYTDGAPGASLWNPDVDVVSIDTVHSQDMPLVADVLSLSCVIAQRTRDIAYRHADNTLLRWRLPHMWVRSSALLGPVFITGWCVLCPMRPARCRHPDRWEGGLHHSLGVPLPLAVAPQGMPRQPCLHVLITRDIQLIAEPYVWLRYIVLGGG
jgi:hypothetical protein